MRRRLVYTTPATDEAADGALCVAEYGNEEFFGLAYADGPEFVVDAAATRLWATYSAPLVIEDLTTYLVGPVMGFVLRRRGITSLHACTVDVDGCVIALCGGGGAGKSTTAAALALKGFSVVCEDVSPIVETEGVFEVPPGYPRVCLWPDAVKLLLGSTDALPRITPTWDKRYLALDGKRAEFAKEAKRLSAIYFLDVHGEGHSAPKVEEMKPSDGLLELVKNSYAKRLLNKKQKAQEFDVLSRLANSVVFRRLTRSTEGRVDALCDLILNDVSGIPAPQPNSLPSSP